MAYHPPKNEGRTLGIATLVGVGLVLVVTFANWRQVGGIQQGVDDRLTKIEGEIAQLSQKVDALPAQAAAPAQQPRSGPDPDKVYAIKTDGAPVKGPADAVITIAEFSDFQ